MDTQERYAGQKNQLESRRTGSSGMWTCRTIQLYCISIGHINAFHLGTFTWNRASLEIRTSSFKSESWDRTASPLTGLLLSFIHKPLLLRYGGFFWNDQRTREVQWGANARIKATRTSARIGSRRMACLFSNVQKGWLHARILMNQVCLLLTDMLFAIPLILLV